MKLSNAMKLGLILLLASNQPFLRAEDKEKKDKKQIEIAPVPRQLVLAKKVFLVNGGGSDLAYDTVYTEIKAWGRYKFVDNPEEAELVFEVIYAVEGRGTHVWSSTNVVTGATQVHSAQLTDPQIRLTVFDPKSKQALWATVEHPRLARREKNRVKELIKAAHRLVENLRMRVETTAAAHAEESPQEQD